MPKTAVNQWSITRADNSDIDGINIAEGCPAGNLNDMGREIMVQVREGMNTGNLMGSEWLSKSAGYTALAVDRGKTINCTAALTLALTAAATLGTGWICIVKANGGDVTIDPNASETINGATTATIKDGTSATIICDGSSFHIVGRMLETVGTAASVNTGTSGGLIPLLNGANTWSGIQTFSASAVFSDVVKVSSGSAAAPGFTFITDTDTGFFLPGAGIIGGAIGGAEVFRFNSEGLLVGATTTSGIDTGSSANVGAYIADGIFAAQNNSSAALLLSKVSSTGAVAEFRVSNSLVGSISVTGSATAYNTSSDYRLEWKKGARPLTDSGVFIDGLTPRYFPEVDQSGFIAHEFQAVSPSSVTGEKDAVDEHGAPIYQAMQASSSEVIAHIVAELQSLRRRVADLEAAKNT